MNSEKNNRSIIFQLINLVAVNVGMLSNIVALYGLALYWRVSNEPGYQASAVVHFLLYAVLVFGVIVTIASPIVSIVNKYWISLFGGMLISIVEIIIAIMGLPILLLFMV